MDESAHRRHALWRSAAIAAGIFTVAGLLVWLGQSSATWTPAGPPRGGNPAAQRRSLVEAAIREKANDPASVTFEKILFGHRGVDQNGSGHVHQYVRVHYRERNAVGAIVYAERVFRIVDDRRLVWLDSDEQFLFGHASSEWVADPAGPPG